MSSYSNKLIFIFLLILTGCSSSQIALKTPNNKNDILIIMALDYELNNQYKSSAKIYTKLYEETKKDEYLQKAVTQNLIAKNYNLSLKLAVNNLDKSNKNDEKFYKFAVVSAMQLKQYQKALELAKRLLKKYNNTTNYEVVANVLYAKGDYKKAIEYFESAYAINTNPKTLISLTNILYAYLNEKKKAISYLETFIRLNGCQNKICNTLITFYMEQHNIDGIISILKMQLKSSTNIIQRYKILNLLVTTLEQKDIHLAIRFLENNQIDNTRLLTLYEQTKEYKKALKLVRKLYLKTKDKSLLGRIAILRFELAKNKKSVMKHIIANFEIALKYTNNASYKNYYGYLLIDYKINIKKGLKLVKEALKSSPTNLAYMDSVAWGYYHINDCQKSKSYMQQVVDQVGLDNQEIKLHWDKIKECKK